jgi:hypothetical protein
MKNPITYVDDEKESDFEKLFWDQEPMDAVL